MEIMSAEDDRLRSRMAEMMSSAGLGYNSISLELLYLIPGEFRDRYIEMWEKALGPAGGGDSRGQQMSRDAQLGRVEVDGGKYKGKMVGAGSGGQGKKWKRVGMEVRDERALDLKSRIDRRLRSIARDIRAELEGLEKDERGEGGENGEGRGERGKTAQCTKCGRVMKSEWLHCPYDGSRLR